ncbi:MAG: hypothetical protein QM765_48620 [Myxococcales bacterium]
MEPPTLLRIDPEKDPRALRDYLDAHFAQERAGLLRELLVHLLAVLSVLVWACAVWPHCLGRVGSDAILAAWAIFAAATVAAVAAEARCRQRCHGLRDRDGVEPPSPS